MLKWFFWLLLIGNAALFAMQRGYLGATASERHEPKRLEQQLHPETLTILPPNSEKLVMPATGSGEAPVATDASAAAGPATGSKPPEAKSETISCTEIGNFNGVEARKFDARLTSLNLPVKATVRNIQETASHMVYIPAQDGKDGADRKAAELRRLGIQDFYVMPESQTNPALRWAISLGVFKTEEAAKAYIGQLIPKGVRSARIIARSSATTKQVYQWRNIDPAARTALEGLKANFPGQEMRSCAG